MKLKKVKKIKTNEYIKFKLTIWLKQYYNTNQYYQYKNI